MNQQIYTPQQNYKVLCNCITYNQSRYIEDTLKGFSMQKTDFQFVCLVVEDCSTDGEQDVIKAWLNRECNMSKAECIDLDLANVIIVPHKSNHSCTLAIYLLKRNLRKEPQLKESLTEPWSQHSEYIALCEGDDYWIDPLKLQKQVDLLDSSPNVGMCYTQSKVYIQKQKILSNVVLAKDCGESFEYMLLREPAITLTSMLRRKLMDQYFKEICPNNKKWLMGDTPLWLWFAANSKIKAMPIVTSVYRQLENSASHSNDIKKLLRFNTSTEEIRLFFCEKYPHLGGHLIEVVKKERLRLSLEDSYNTNSLWYFMCFFVMYRMEKRKNLKRLLLLIKYKIKNCI